jgi:hypothetical protein
MKRPHQLISRCRSTAWVDTIVLYLYRYLFTLHGTNSRSVMLHANTLPLITKKNIHLYTNKNSLNMMAVFQSFPRTDRNLWTVHLTITNTRIIYTTNAFLTVHLQYARTDAYLQGANTEMSGYVCVYVYVCMYMCVYIYTPYVRMLNSICMCMYTYNACGESESQHWDGYVRTYLLMRVVFIWLIYVRI